MRQITLALSARTTGIQEHLNKRDLALQNVFFFSKKVRAWFT